MMPPGLPARSSPAHLVQFYDQDIGPLVAGVSRYLAEGLRRGEGAIVIATPAHREGIACRLRQDGIDTQCAMESARLRLEDTEATLGSFMQRDRPDWPRFKSAIEALIGGLREAASDAPLRAYGEMVDVLWNAGYSAAAAKLEQFWNRLLAVHGFSLFCAYQIDIFGREFQPSVLEPLLRSHTHLLPAGEEESLDAAVNRALDDVLGSRAGAVKRALCLKARPSWAAIPEAEAKVLWVRNNLPDYSDEILSRARGYYEALGCSA